MFHNFIQARQDVQIATFDEANNPKHPEDILFVALTSMLLINPRDSTLTHIVLQCLFFYRVHKSIPLDFKVVGCCSRLTAAGTSKAKNWRSREHPTQRNLIPRFTFATPNHTVVGTTGRYQAHPSVSKAILCGVWLVKRLRSQEALIVL